MKALTVSQPFASLIANGEKWIENRTWGTPYRGRLAIHAGKGTQYVDLGELGRFVTGAVVAIATLACCVPRERLLRMEENSRIPLVNKTVGEILAHKHCEGPWCWILINVRKLDPPVRTPGLPGLWDWKRPATLKEAG